MASTSERDFNISSVVGKSIFFQKHTGRIPNKCFSGSDLLEKPVNALFVKRKAIGKTNVHTRKTL